MIEAKKNTVTAAQVKGLMAAAEVETTTLFGKVTVVAVKLPNGFVLVESSGCVDPANYDKDIGVACCMKRIEDKVWMLEGYALQDRLHQKGGL
jgi:hypothetical protein